MTTDNKTLADVQPGGRVRLGDQVLSTSEGARRYVADFFATQLRRHDFGDYILTELAGDFACALAQHLSAQPSPGGQHGVWMLPDDARIVGVIADSIERGKLDHPGFYRNTQLGEVLRRVLSAALAALQPVGEPVAWLVHWSDMPLESPEVTRSASRISEVSALTNPPRIVPLYAPPPAQAVDLGQIIEQIAQQWDGCSYDSVGETIDVGQAIRAAGMRLAMAHSQAVGK